MKIIERTASFSPCRTWRYSLLHCRIGSSEIQEREGELIPALHCRIGSSEISPCRTWRYSLLRRWAPGDYAMFIGLNPSTADETQDDPTVRRCIRYAQSWGYGALYMTNIFAFRATDPKVMKRFDDPIGPENDTALIRLAAHAGIVIAAWGVHGEHMGRGNAVRRFLHPLYLKADLKPKRWE